MNLKLRIARLHRQKWHFIEIVSRFMMCEWLGVTAWISHNNQPAQPHPEDIPINPNMARNFMLRHVRHQSIPAFSICKSELKKLESPSKFKYVTKVCHQSEAIRNFLTSDSWDLNAIKKNPRMALNILTNVPESSWHVSRLKENMLIHFKLRKRRWDRSHSTFKNFVYPTGEKGCEDQFKLYYTKTR